MIYRISLLLFILLNLTSCGTTNTISETTLQSDDEIEFTYFTPTQTTAFTLEGFEIDVIYQVDSCLIFSAYAEGDFATSKNPTNWGDRLVQVKDGAILFQSVPVGDPYEYSPHFYQNEINDKVIIVCHLGNEDHYGGEVFILEDGEIHFIGVIEIETPLDLPNNNSLIDILTITERDASMYFEFNSDTLLYLGNDEWEEVINDDIHYRYSDEKFELIGL